MWDNPDTAYVTLGNTTVRTSLHKHFLGNFISNNIYDRNIKAHVCRYIGKTNAIVCNFGCCDSSTLGNRPWPNPEKGLFFCVRCNILEAI